MIEAEESLPTGELLTRARKLLANFTRTHYTPYTGRHFVKKEDVQVMLGEHERLTGHSWLHSQEGEEFDRLCQRLRTRMKSYSPLIEALYEVYALTISQAVLLMTFRDTGDFRSSALNETVRKEGAEASASLERFVISPLDSNMDEAIEKAELFFRSIAELSDKASVAWDEQQTTEAKLTFVQLTWLLYSTS